MVDEQLRCMVGGITEEAFFDLCDAFEAPRDRLIVLVDEHQEETYSGILLLPFEERESEHVKHRLKNHRLIGATVVSSGIADYHAGDRVHVFPWCLQGVIHMAHGDPSCSCSNKIPKGRELRFYKPDYTRNEKGDKVLCPSYDSNGKMVPQGSVRCKVPLIGSEF